MTIIRTHYDNLKVSREAPIAVINAAYKALCQIYHPDKFQGNHQEAEAIFKIIVQSYTVLSDPVKKAEHDQWISQQEKQHRQGFVRVLATAENDCFSNSANEAVNKRGTTNKQDPTENAVFSVGDQGPAGGIVFYVDSASLHGLEAQPEDYNTDGLTWFDAMAVVSQYGPDWRLPTKDELNLLYRAKAVVGGFSNRNYWSSTKTLNASVWTQYFSNGYQYDYNGNLKLLVRAVRAF